MVSSRAKRGVRRTTSAGSQVLQSHSTRSRFPSGSFTG